MSDGGLSTRAKAAIVLAAQGMSAFVAYGSLLVAGRFFSPESFGMHSFAIGATALMGVVTDLGVGLAHQRAVARGLDRGRALTALVVLRLALVVGLTLLALVVGAVGLPWFTAQVQDAVTLNVLLVAVVVQMLVLVRGILEATWLGEQRPHLVEGFRLVDSVVTLVVLVNAGLLVAALAGVHPPFMFVGQWWADVFGLEHPLGFEEGALLIVGSYAVGKAAALLAALVYGYRDRLRLGPWDAGVARGFVRVAIPLSVAYFMTVVLTSTDVVALGFFGNARDVAYYAAAQRIATIGILVTVAVGTVLFPRFAQLHAAGEHDSLEATAVHAHRYLLILVAPMAAAMLALPAQGLVAVLGPEYVGSVDALRWLAAWIVLLSVMNPLIMRLVGEGRDRLVVVGNVVNAGLNVVLDLAMVPPWGAAGAAAATALSTAGALVVIIIAARARAVQGMLQRQAPRVAMAAAATGLLWAAAGLWLPPTWLDHTLELVLAGIVGLVAYAYFLWLSGALDDEDLRVLRTLVRPKTWLMQR